MKKLIFILMAMLLFTLPKPALGQVFPTDRHTLQNGVYEIYYSTSALDAVRNYNIYVMAKLPGSQPFFLSSVAGDMENIRGKEQDKLILWSPLLEGKTPDNYSFEIHAIDSRILAARQDGRKFDIKEGFGKVKVDSNLKDAIIKLNKQVIEQSRDLVLPAGTYLFTAEAKDLPQITKNHIVRKDQNSTVMLSFAISYLTIFVNKKDVDIDKILVKPEYKTFTNNFKREIKPAVKYMFPTSIYTISVQLNDGSIKEDTVILIEGESKSLRIDFAKMDLSGYEWTKKIRSNIGRAVSEVQMGVFFNEDYSGFTFSIPLFYSEWRNPAGSGAYYTGRIGFSESVGYMFSSSNYGDLSGFFGSMLPIGVGLAYSSPNLYNLSAMLKGGFYIPPIHEDYKDDTIGHGYIDIGVSFDKYLKNHKNFRFDLRYRLLDSIKESKRRGWPIHQGTFFINLGFNFYEIAMQ